MLYVERFKTAGQREKKLVIKKKILDFGKIPVKIMFPAMEYCTWREYPSGFND